MSEIKLGMLLAEAREHLPEAHESAEDGESDGEREYLAVCYDDSNAPVFSGALLYADGGYLGVLCDDGQVVEWPLELVQMQG